MEFIIATKFLRPAFYVIAAAIVTLMILLRTRETAFAPLR
jgi:hypothetical protein